MLGVTNNPIPNYVSSLQTSNSGNDWGQGGYVGVDGSGAFVALLACLVVGFLFIAVIASAGSGGGGPRR